MVKKKETKVIEKITPKLKAIDFPKIRLIFDNILLTIETNRVSPGGIILSSNKRGEIKGRQTVVAVGPHSAVKVGEEVEIDFGTFKSKLVARAKNDIGPDQYTIDFPIVTIGKKEYLYISPRNLKWVYTD